MNYEAIAKTTWTISDVCHGWECVGDGNKGRYSPSFEKMF